MTEHFEDFLTSCQSSCSEMLSNVWMVHHDELRTAELNSFFQAGNQSLVQGGKRVRPALVFAAAEAVLPGSKGVAGAAACAIELIHTYSLIHDDLPAMDDDDLRRGKPTLHKAFDEATAILVGDGLQARAFEILVSSPDLSPEQKIKMVEVLAVAAGPEGMVGGQAIDIAAVDTKMNLERLQVMHALKTGALICASLTLGGIAANANSQQLIALNNYGRSIGLAFQVVDDILDIEGDTTTLGKTQGKDIEANKPTYVKLMGIEGAKLEAERLLSEALNSLEGFDESADHLRNLAAYIIERKY